MTDVLEAELTAEEILTFGACVEAVTWTTVWLEEQRAPIAVAAGRPKLGPVFNSDGVGKAVVIRPCVSRGRRIRGLPPVYTPAMLEKHSNVFDGWPMFTDHVPAELAATLAKHGRSVKELAGQVLKGGWSRDFVQESDGDFGYQKGGVLAEVWATPLIRRTVGENPNLLHTSIHAWPTSGKPGAVPWRAGAKGMLIEGIRRLPQGSVDYVVRGGAGGKLLLAEGFEDEGSWPEVGEWDEDSTRLVVSLAESLYASQPMTPNTPLTLPSDPTELRAWMQEHASHLLPALGESEQTVTPPAAPPVSVTEADVRRIMDEALAEAQRGVPSAEDFEQRLLESVSTTLTEREEQRTLAEHAHELIRVAEGVPDSWKADLRTRYSLQPEGAPSALLVEGDETDDQGNALSAVQVIEARVNNDLEHVADLLAEARGKPRVRGEGSRKADPTESTKTTTPGRKPAAEVPYWREAFVEMGISESADKALEVFGGSVEG